MYLVKWKIKINGEYREQSKYYPANSREDAVYCLSDVLSSAAMLGIRDLIEADIEEIKEIT